MSQQAFYPEEIVQQIKTFFSDVHDLSDFYYKLYLLNGLCRVCDGRGYLQEPEQSCVSCQASGSRDIWHPAKIRRSRMEPVQAEVPPLRRRA
jgi:hypothetical protein